MAICYIRGYEFNPSIKSNLANAGTMYIKAFLIEPASFALTISCASLISKSVFSSLFNNVIIDRLASRWHSERMNNERISKAHSTSIVFSG